MHYTFQNNTDDIISLPVITVTQETVNVEIPAKSSVSLNGRPHPSAFNSEKYRVSLAGATVVINPRLRRPTSGFQNSAAPEAVSDFVREQVSQKASINLSEVAQGGALIQAQARRNIGITDANDKLKSEYFPDLLQVRVANRTLTAAQLSTTGLADGEIAINVTDNKLVFGLGGSNIEVGGGGAGGGSGAASLSPNLQEIWLLGTAARLVAAT
jgi:hypothetical protein